MFLLRNLDRRHSDDFFIESIYVWKFCQFFNEKKVAFSKMKNNLSQVFGKKMAKLIKFGKILLIKKLNFKYFSPK